MVRRTLLLMFIFAFAFTFENTLFADDPPGFKYVGTKTCGMCHKKDNEGNQLKVWEGSKHSQAYKSLLTEEANKIAKEKGVGDKAVEAEACLKCHTTGYNLDASMLDKKFSIEDGVQCETCHGPGEKYKSMKIMKDHASAIENGLTDFSSKEKIEAHCKKCHNEESPTFKEFKFDEMWAKIKHNIPEK